MRSHIGGTILAATLALSTLTNAALAAQQAQGSVKAFDAKASTLELQDGQIFTLPKDFRDPGLKSGTRVQISWEMKDGKHAADKVVILK